MWGTRTRKSWLGPWGDIACLIALAAIVVGTAGCPPVNPGEGEGEGEGEPPSFAPGLELAIQEVVIPEDLRPEVIFELLDEDGNAVPVSELTDIRFMLAYLAENPNEGTSRYTSYNTRIENPDGVQNSGDEEVQATYDGARLAGVSANGDGTYTYKFTTAIPAEYDATATHQVGGQVVREYFVNEQEYVDNPLFMFVPNGSAVTETRDIVTTEVCNVCHTDLTLHGERHEIQLCILCHTPQSTDANTGNTVDMPQMIHKIHRGADLPSVQAGEPYRIIGFQNSVHDYSTVGYPQDIRNCQSCHADASQADVWMTTPTLAGCASCHDRTWFGSSASTPEGWENHVGGAQSNSANCALCHTAEAIADNHTLPKESANAVGLNVTITNIATEDVEGGAQVIVDFTVADNNGAPYTTFEAIQRLRVNVAWPAQDYQNNVREDLLSPPAGSTLVNNGGGAYTYTFNNLFPAGTSDVFALGFEGRIAFEYDEVEEEQGIESSEVTFFTTDGSEPEPRRSIVSDAKCNACHYDLHFHGESRTNVDYCAFCHRPNESGDGFTINFKDMVHKIHRGEELETEFFEFNEIRFPGDESQCTICHEDGTYELPLPDGVQPTVIEEGEEVLVTLPESAACTSCHDGAQATLHAALNTDFDGSVESCAVCHGAGAAFDVETVHAGE